MTTRAIDPDLLDTWHRAHRALMKAADAYGRVTAGIAALALQRDLDAAFTDVEIDGEDLVITDHRSGESVRVTTGWSTR